MIVTTHNNIATLTTPPYQVSNQAEDQTNLTETL